MGDPDIVRRFETQRQQLDELRDITERAGAKLREAMQLVAELGKQKLQLQLELDVARRVGRSEYEAQLIKLAADVRVTRAACCESYAWVKAPPKDLDGRALGVMLWEDACKAQEAAEFALMAHVARGPGE